MGDKDYAKELSLYTKDHKGEWQEVKRINDQYNDFNDNQTEVKTDNDDRSRII